MDPEGKALLNLMASEERKLLCMNRERNGCLESEGKAEVRYMVCERKGRKRLQVRTGKSAMER
jgi:hypothetical protein